MLPFAHYWKVRCRKCGHRGEITAAVIDLADKPLRCGRCGHRQDFAPETVQGAPRRRHDRRSIAARQVPTTLAPRELNDSLSDLWAAG